MKGGKDPSVAVMLGMPKDEDSEGDEGESSLSETKARAEDAATAFAAAVGAKDAKKIVATFCSLQTLCGKLSELEEDGETPDEEEAEEPKDEAAEE